MIHQKLIIRITSDDPNVNENKGALGILVHPNEGQTKALFEKAFDAAIVIAGMVKLCGSMPILTLGIGIPVNAKLVSIDELCGLIEEETQEPCGDTGWDSVVLKDKHADLAAKLDTVYSLPIQMVFLLDGGIPACQFKAYVDVDNCYYESGQYTKAELLSLFP
jgi:hypothetical protein